MSCNLQALMYFLTHSFFLFRTPLVISCFPLYFFKKLFIYLFLIFWLCWVFVAVCQLSLVAARAGATLCRGARASHCGGFSCCGARALAARASVVVARGLGSCGSQALERRLGSCGSRA